MTDHGLTDREVGILREVLAPYADLITRAGLFGSRATGRAQPNSDIDLVLYGPIDQATLDRLWTLFDESGLSRRVDLMAYDLIEHPPLKAHIDRVMVPLFEGSDLGRGIPEAIRSSDHRSG